MCERERERESNKKKKKQQQKKTNVERENEIMILLKKRREGKEIHIKESRENSGSKIIEVPFWLYTLSLPFKLKRRDQISLACEK